MTPGSAKPARRSEAPEREEAQPERKRTRSERKRTRTFGVIALLIVAAIVAAVLATGISLGGDDDPSEPLTIAEAAAFDPEGDPPGDEHNGEAPLAIDGDRSTAWTTETYRDPTQLGKRGVGLVVRFDEVRSIGALRVQTTTTNWSAAVYATTGEVGPDLESWGDPVTSASGLGPPAAVFDLDGVEARAVLVWITRVGDERNVAVTEVIASG